MSTLKKRIRSIFGVTRDAGASATVHDNETGMSKEPTAMEALLDEGMAQHQAGDLAQARDRHRTVLSSDLLAIRQFVEASGG